jgi:UDP-N-acetyl-D-glucosamine/UDP-N-acetyl-D-galactosamine dehydrogenase
MLNKILKEKICVVGLGYVGLPLAHAFSLKGYKVVGFDIDQRRIDELNSGYDRTLELDEFQITQVRGNLKYSLNIDEIRDCSIYIVTVPTPIDSLNRPDLTPLVKSSQIIGRVLSKDDIVIYESTVYPGVTEDVCVPELEKVSGMKFNEDFFCGYSPERINPGDKERTVTKILKVTSGSTPEIATKVDALYASIITAGTHKCSSIKVAEASKVIENTQRDVNIALINELAFIFDAMDIDTRDVIEAAATKWNFIRLTPGLVGGHCIGVDPYYLIHKSEELGYKPNLILGARQINNGMAKYIAEKTIKLMIEKSYIIKGENILIMGLTFKENCPDTRNTKVVHIISELEEYGVNIDVYEPYIDEKEKDYYNYSFVSNPLKNSKKYGVVIVAVGHDEFKAISIKEFENLMKGEKILIDVKSILENPTWRL